MSINQQGGGKPRGRLHGTTCDKRPKMYMAMDQFGTCHHGLKHPRKELMELYGVSKTAKMYQDRDGQTYHTGYIVKAPESISPGFEHWFTIYEVKRWEKLA